MKKLMMMAVVAAAMPILADEETVGGYTWTYRIVGDTAEIYGTYNYSSGKYTPCISPSPTSAVTIPSALGGKPVTSIGSYAFSGCSGLESVTIPDGVTRIGNYAFYNCSGLTSVTIPGSVTSIGLYAFCGCSGLMNVVIGSSVTSIEEYAFYDCSGLTSVTIPDSVTSIWRYAFYGCSGLTSVTIPDSVTSIGNDAFRGCSGLTSVTIPDSVTSIGSSAFSGCSGLTSITLPFVGSLRGNSGTSDSVFGYIFGTWSHTGDTETRQYYSSLYGSSTYYYIPTALKTVTITDETVLGYGAFSGCSGLTSVTIPDSVTSIGGGAFYDCSGLKSVTIPNSVTSIGEWAFLGCSGLTSVTIPNSVTSIGYEAFSSCSGLTSVTIPDSVTSIGFSAFSGCSGLMSISVGSGNANYKSVNGLLLSKDGKTLIQGVNGGDVTIPDGVTSIGYEAFYGCSGLTSVTIPDSVTSIGDRAFYNYSGLTNVVIGSSVTSIGYEAFYGCSGLTGVMIPNSVTSIGSSAFSYCSGLTSVHITDLAKWCGISFGDSDANPLYYANDLYLNGEKVTDLVIPDGVTRIGNSAFSGCSGLTSVTIPDGVTSIGRMAFYGCSGLTSVTIPNSVTSIGEWAFLGCSGLKSVTIPNSVTSIGNHAFSWCEGLGMIVFDGNSPLVLGEVFSGIATNCTVYVHRGSTGWGVVIPGTWNGLKIAYMEDMPSPDPTPDPDPVTPDPVTPDPVTPDPVTPDPVTPDPGTPDSVLANEVAYGGDVADDAFSKAQTVVGALRDAKGSLAGIVEVKIGKKGKKGVKVSAAATVAVDGKAKKVGAKAVTLADGETVKTLAFKDPIGDMVFVMAADGSFTLKNAKYEMVGAVLVGGALHAIKVGGNLPNGTKHFNEAMGSVPSFGAGLSLLEAALPTNVPVHVSGGTKWSCDKAASLKYKNIGGAYRLTGLDGAANSAGLKLSYTAKTGVFKGSYRLYATSGGEKPKLKKFTVNVIGFVVDGRGEGLAVMKKPSADPWFVSVE